MHVCTHHIPALLHSLPSACQLQDYPNRTNKVLEQQGAFLGLQHIYSITTFKVEQNSLTWSTSLWITT